MKHNYLSGNLQRIHELTLFTLASCTLYAVPNPSTFHHINNNHDSLNFNYNWITWKKEINFETLNFFASLEWPIIELMHNLLFETDFNTLECIKTNVLFNAFCAENFKSERNFRLRSFSWNEPNAIHLFLFQQTIFGQTSAHFEVKNSLE